MATGASLDLGEVEMPEGARDQRRSLHRAPVLTPGSDALLARRAGSTGAPLMEQQTESHVRHLLARCSRGRAHVENEIESAAYHVGRGGCGRTSSSCVKRLSQLLVPRSRG